MRSYCGSALRQQLYQCNFILTTTLFPLGRGKDAALRGVEGLWLRGKELRAQVCEQMEAGD